MKALLVGIMAFISVASFAQADCTDEGKLNAENELIRQLRLRGVSAKVNIFTKSSYSNVYGSLHCTYETVYSFVAKDSVNGKKQTYLGRSVINNSGEKPIEDILEVSSSR